MFSTKYQFSMTFLSVSLMLLIHVLHVSSKPIPTSDIVDSDQKRQQGIQNVATLEFKKLIGSDETESMPSRMRSNQSRPINVDSMIDQFEKELKKQNKSKKIKKSKKINKKVKQVKVSSSDQPLIATSIITVHLNASNVNSSHRSMNKNNSKTRTQYRQASQKDRASEHGLKKYKLDRRTLNEADGTVSEKKATDTGKADGTVSEKKATDTGKADGTVSEKKATDTGKADGTVSEKKATDTGKADGTVSEKKATDTGKADGTVSEKKTTDTGKADGTGSEKKATDTKPKSDAPSTGPGKIDRTGSEKTKTSTRGNAKSDPSLTDKAYSNRDQYDDSRLDKFENGIPKSGSSNLFDNFVSLKKSKSHQGGKSNDAAGSNKFIILFIVAVFAFGGLYVIYHKKQKILACIVEGRRISGSRSRTGSRRTSCSSSTGSGYKQVPTDEQTLLPDSKKPDSVQKFIY